MDSIGVFFSILIALLLVLSVVQAKRLNFTNKVKQIAVGLLIGIISFYASTYIIYLIRLSVIEKMISIWELENIDERIVLTPLITILSISFILVIYHLWVGRLKKDFTDINQIGIDDKTTEIE